MNPLLNQGEIRNTIAFLNRVDLKGAEAITLALLQQKLGAALTEQTKQPTPAAATATPPADAPAADAPAA